MPALSCSLRDAEQWGHSDSMPCVSVAMEEAVSRTLNASGAHVLPQCLHFICCDAMSKTMLPLHFEQRNAIILSHSFLLMDIMSGMIANFTQLIL